MVIRAGGLPMVGNPMKIAPWPDPTERRRAPELDEHGPAIRAVVGRSGSRSGAGGDAEVERRPTTP
jgi:hypothetical protein